MEALYGLIHQAITPEGTLPKGFSLPSQDKVTLRFIDGAMDGIAVFHTNISSEDTSLLEQSVHCASGGDMEEAHRLALQYCTNKHMLSAIDGIQNYIIAHKDELSPAKLFEFGRELILRGTDREMVKFGLSLLELLNLGQNEELKEAVRELACSDEFTLFALFVMQTWDNANDFQITPKSTASPPPGARPTACSKADTANMLCKRIWRREKTLTSRKSLALTMSLM